MVPYGLPRVQAQTLWRGVQTVATGSASAQRSLPQPVSVLRGALRKISGWPQALERIRSPRVIQVSLTHGRPETRLLCSQDLVLRGKAPIGLRWVKERVRKLPQALMDLSGLPRAQIQSLQRQSTELPGMDHISWQLDLQTRSRQVLMPLPGPSAPLQDSRQGMVLCGPII